MQQRLFVKKLDSEVSVLKLDCIYVFRTTLFPVCNACFLCLILNSQVQTKITLMTSSGDFTKLLHSHRGCNITVKVPFHSNVFCLLLHHLDV